MTKSTQKLFHDAVCLEVARTLLEKGIVTRSGCLPATPQITNMEFHTKGDRHGAAFLEQDRISVSTSNGDRKSAISIKIPRDSLYGLTDSFSATRVAREITNAVMKGFDAGSEPQMTRQPSPVQHKIAI